jgi:hypothetical protein
LEVEIPRLSSINLRSFAFATKDVVLDNVPRNNLELFVKEAGD